MVDCRRLAQSPQESPLINRHDEPGLRSETVRRTNLSAIVRELHLYGPLSRSELGTRTGLTRGAIRVLIGELVARGLATEHGGAAAGTPGRPSVLVRLNQERAFVLALEVSVDSLAAAIVGLGGAVERLVRVERPRAHVAPSDVVADLADIAADLLLETGSAKRELVGVGVGVVGIVRHSDGFVTMAPNLGWHNVPLGRSISIALGTRAPISVANEADLGALAEHRRGAAVGEYDLIYISGEVGVGAGVFVGGHPLTGTAGFGGEVGHLPLNPNGLPCACGSIGCWETEAGERALLARAGRPVDGGRQAVDELLADAFAGDEIALASVHSIGEWLGRGLAGLINIFNPRLIVLGGLFSRTFPLVEPILHAELERLALPASREVVDVVPSLLGTDAPLLGAAELAFDPLLADPAAWLSPAESVKPLLASA
jgi:predicted NBD/HSP70 family sugar kinase